MRGATQEPFGVCPEPTRFALRVTLSPQVALESFNTTHTINKLTFGDPPPAGHASSKHMAASTVLEGHHKTVQDTHAMHQARKKPHALGYDVGSCVTQHDAASFSPVLAEYLSMGREKQVATFYVKRSNVEIMWFQAPKSILWLQGYSVCMCFLRGALYLCASKYTISCAVPSCAFPQKGLPFLQQSATVFVMQYTVPLKLFVPHLRASY